MPSVHMPLRHHPSLQAVRQVDESQDRTELNTTISQHSRSRDNGLNGRQPPGIQVQDFQNHDWPSSRRPSVGNASISARMKANPTPSMPDLYQRLNQVPLPSGSANQRHESFSDENQATDRDNSRKGPEPMSHSPAYYASRSASPVSLAMSHETYETQATSSELPPLQTQSLLDDSDQMQPLPEDLAGCFDLVAPPEEGHRIFSLETRSEQLFSREHLETIFSDPSLLLRFTAFLSTHRPQSVPILIYYLDALKALKAINYANAIAEALSPIPSYDFTTTPAKPTINSVLEDKAAQSFDVLVREDLPAYITLMYTQIVSLSISQRITGTLAPHLREASEGLAEVFCVTDPSRPDNPIVFVSEGKFEDPFRWFGRFKFEGQNSTEPRNMA